MAESFDLAQGPPGTVVLNVGGKMNPAVRRSARPTSNWLYEVDWALRARLF